MTINYTIIIPHKNILKLLERCLASIPQRDDLEVIIVDDNSDPNVVDFEKFPGKDRPNTTVIFDKSGKGAGRARNIGLENAKGKWLIFADADDMFEKGIDKILNSLETETADIVYFGVVSKDSNTLAHTDEANFFMNILLSHDDNALRYKLLTPWMKAIRKKLTDKHNIRFEEVPCSNDTRFSALCGYYAKSVSVNPEIGYCWMRREGSLWRKKDINWYIVRYKVSLRIAKFMLDKGENCIATFFSGHAYNLINDMLQYSIVEHIKGRVSYGVMTGDYKVIILTIPRLFLHYLIILKNYIVIKKRT